MTTDPADLTARAALREIGAGRLTAESVREACLARVVAREPVLRAMAALEPALVRQAVPLPGTLDGLPVGVKDVLDTADLATEYNSPIWHGHRPIADAACVAWARAAGAVVFGKIRDHRVRHPLSRPDHQPARPGTHTGRFE